MREINVWLEGGVEKVSIEDIDLFDLEPNEKLIVLKQLFKSNRYQSKEVLKEEVIDCIDTWFN